MAFVGLSYLFYILYAVFYRSMRFRRRRPVENQYPHRHPAPSPQLLSITPRAKRLLRGAVDVEMIPMPRV